MNMSDLGNFDIMIVFDFILLLYGAYSVYASRKMMRDGQPPQWLMSADELQRIRRPGEFCDYMAPRTLLFGILCVLYGIYGLLVSLYLKKPVLEGIGVAVFLACIVWFIVTLRNAKKKYI